MHLEFYVIDTFLQISCIYTCAYLVFIHCKQHLPLDAELSIVGLRVYCQNTHDPGKQ